METMTIIAIGSISAVLTSIFMGYRVKERELLKERLEKLYLPLNKMLNSPHSRVGNYDTFIKLEKLYFDFEHLVSPKLEHVLYDIISAHHSLLGQDLTEDEVKEKMIEGSYKNYKNLSRSFDYLMDDVRNIVSANTAALLRQYRGGFKLHLLNFIQFFSWSPHSAKTWKEGYLDYTGGY